MPSVRVFRLMPPASCRITAPMPPIPHAKPLKSKWPVCNVLYTTPHRKIGMPGKSRYEPATRTASHDLPSFSVLTSRKTLCSPRNMSRFRDATRDPQIVDPVDPAIQEAGLCRISGYDAAQERLTLVAELGGHGECGHGVHSGERVAPDDAVLQDTDSSLQQHAGTRSPGVDGSVEHAQVNGLGQLASLGRYPVAGVIDLRSFIQRDHRHRLLRQPLADAEVIVRGLRDAVVGRATVVSRVVAIAAFLFEGEGEAVVESSHGGPRIKQSCDPVCH